MKINLAALNALLRQLAAITGIVVSTGNVGHLPVSVRTALVAVSGVLLTTEHAVNKLQGKDGNVVTVKKLATQAVAAVDTPLPGSAA